MLNSIKYATYLLLARHFALRVRKKLSRSDRCGVPTVTYDILLDSNTFQNFSEDDSSWPYIPPVGKPM